MKKAIAFAAVAVLGLAACGSDNESSEDTVAETTEAPMSSGDIVAVASSTEGFSTLVSVIQAAGLTETLQGDGPFTVFAPTDDAFAALPAGVLDKLLLPENVEVLKSILLYHVISGLVMSADVTAGDVATQEGSTVKIATDGGVTVNGAMVTTVDVTATNGVIHAIDQVLVPPTVDLNSL